MRVIRAHDGHSISVNQPLSQFQTIDDLFDCFSLATEIPSDAIICMTASGSQLKDDTIQQIAQQQDDEPRDPSHVQQQHEFFVFNRDFLYNDPEALAAELAEDAALESPAGELEIVHPPTPRSLDALVAWSSQVARHVEAHQYKSGDLLDHVECMLRSTHVASLNLYSHFESIKKGAEALAQVTDRELSRMQNLLQGHQRDLQVLGMVSIHPRLLSLGQATSSSTDAKSKMTASKDRSLGDYVSRVKMSAVADACTKVYNELRERVATLKASQLQLDQDTAALTKEVEGTSIDPSTETHHEAVEASARAQQLFRFIDSNCSPNEQGWPATDKLDDQTYDQAIQATEELLLLDEVARQSVLRLTQDRNDMLARCIELLQDISSLQSDYADLGSNLAAVDADLHSNKVDGFKHLHRLKNMLWAYGATVLEVVRRREFAQHFLGKSQTLAELMAKLSATERKRRQQYRTDVVGQLPWEVKGMEETAPSLEITTSRTGGDGLAELGREDLEALLKLLDVVDQRLTLEGEGQISDGPSPIQEVKATLQQLMAGLDDREAEFIYLVRTQLLGDDDDDENDPDGSEGQEDESGSDTSIRARRLARKRKLLEAAPHRSQIEALELQLRDQQAASEKARQEAADLHRAELDPIRSEVEKLHEELAAERAKAVSLETEKDTLRAELGSIQADLELEKERRLNMADEVSHLRVGLEEARRAEGAARQEAIEERDHANEIEAHLHAMQVELDEAKAARLDASNRIEALLGEGSSAEQELRAAQLRIDELTEQVSAAHTETAKVRESIAEIEAAKEKQIRSYRAEADGDRAILEEKVRALEMDLQDQSVRMARAEDSRKPDHEAIELLRGQLRAADDAHEEIVKEMEQARAFADQAEAGRRELEASRQLLLDKTRPLLARSHQLRKAVKAMPAMSSSSKSASNGALRSAQRQSSYSAAMTMSVVSEAEKQAAMEAFEAEAEGADLEMTLEALRVFDAAEMYEEVKGKLDSLTTLIRKWQKAYKSSNEKTQRALVAARDKIAFRNFQAGDLALFLPTRNSNAKPWAAFNISFPHFFLRATGQLAEQLKTKEWIVARITNITDQVATNSSTDEQSNGNPFQLAEGVRFYLLDVETWNGSSAAPPGLRTRKGSAAASSSAATTTEASRKEKMAERRKSDLLPARSAAGITAAAAAAPTAGTDEAKAVQDDANDSAAVPSQGAQIEDDKRRSKEKQALHRRASEGDAPSQPAGFSSIKAEEAAAHSSTPPMMMTPDASPPSAMQALAAGDRGPADAPLVPLTPAGGAPLVSPPLSSERRTRSQDPHANIVTDFATAAAGFPGSPSPVTGPSALTRVIRATSPASSRFDRNGAAGVAGGNGGVRAWHSKLLDGPGSEEGYADAGAVASNLATREPEAPAPAGLGTGMGMGITGSSFGGPVGHPTSHGTVGEGNASVGGASTSGSDARSAIMERAAARPAFGRRPFRARLEARSSPAASTGPGLLSAPTSLSYQGAIPLRQEASLSHDVGPANPFSQSPSAAQLSTSLADDRLGLRRPSMVHHIDSTGEDGGVAARIAAGSKGGQASQLQSWTDAPGSVPMPALTKRRGSAGKTSGFSLTPSPSAGTVGSPRGLAGSLAAARPEPVSSISTDEARGESVFPTHVRSSVSHGFEDPTTSAVAPAPSTSTVGSGTGFLSQTIGRFSRLGDAGPPWSPPTASKQRRDSDTPASVTGTGSGPGAATASPRRSSPTSRAKTRPSLGILFAPHPSGAAASPQSPSSSASAAAPAGGASSSPSAASQLLRRVGGFL